MNPHCLKGQHRKCVGQVWDTKRDAAVTCECPCHDEGFDLE